MESVSVYRVRVRGPQGESTHLLRSGTALRMGSRKGCDIHVEGDQGLDGIHLILRAETDGVWIEDASSIRGTFVNGRRVRRQRLNNGDKVTASEVSIGIVSVAASATGNARECAVTEFIPAVRGSSRPIAVSEPLRGGDTSGDIKPGANLTTVLPSGISVTRTTYSPEITFHTEAGQHLYAVLDFASDRLIQRAVIRHRGRSELLFEGKRARQFTAVGPYLVEFRPGSELLRYLRSEGWGRNWGIYIVSAADFANLRHHLRRFLLIKLPNGREAYFRFFDPRVLRSFLPVCEPDQADEIFNGVAAIVAEGQNPSVTERFEWKRGHSEVWRYRPSYRKAGN